ncbi:hypothetical protein H6P81_009261 [Aristolochia fimbriata]|uniref:Transposase MuDR plant domain-containing protein n=1 Tax=Aristolochia fimbriata TaxID=158543 RepID=A0AAV7ENJ5_ARIFI|nr:hypothetical protein H6P81_009261 [Aristolochia fimbriata]
MSSKITILCWHGCRFEREHGNIVNHYGGESILSSIDSTSSFQVFMTKLYELTGWNPANDLILVRVRIQLKPGVYRYVEVKNDENLATSFSLVLTGIVFVLELVLERSSSQHREEVGMQSEVLCRNGQFKERCSQVQGNQNIGGDEYYFPRDACSVNLQENVPKHLKRKIRHVAGTGSPSRNVVESHANMTQSSRGNGMRANKYCAQNDGNDNFGYVGSETHAKDHNKEPLKANMDRDATPGDIRAGITFPDKETLERCLQRYSVESHFQFRVVRSTHSMYHVKCIKDECPWRVYASYSMPIQKFMIRSYYGDHKCVTSRFITNEIMPMVKRNLTLSLDDICKIIKDKYRIDITYEKAREARYAAYKAVFGGWVEWSNFLPKFFNAVRETNPNSIHVLCCEQVGNKRMFKSVFWAFGPSINGFRYCRPVICLDGIRLNRKYPRYLLVATTLDGDNGLFPLAFAIVKSESETTWQWFLTCLDQFVICG